jgi:CubicO group peptidase (beta-lactamase class C family)
MPPSLVFARLREDAESQFIKRRPGWSILAVAVLCILGTLAFTQQRNDSLRDLYSPVLTSWHREQLTSLAEKALAHYGPKYNWQIVYGNLKTGEQEHLVFGKQADGAPLKKDNYMRWMSMSKIMGALIAGKALEEGIVSIDDKIAEYLPEFAKDKMRVINDFANGTESCTTDITVRHLLAMEGGFGYDMSQFLPQQKVQYLKQHYGGYMVFMFARDRNTDLVVRRLAQLPLLSQPGTVAQYGWDYDVLGAVISVALERAGHQMTCAQYLRTKVLAPLGMTNTWFLGGELQPPEDAARKMTDAVFMNATGRFWCSEAPGGPCDQLIPSSVMYAPEDPTLKYTGLLGAGGAGPLTDFAKILKLVMREGALPDGTQLISKQVMRFLQGTSAHEETARPMVYAGSPANIQVDKTSFGYGMLPTFSSTKWAYGGFNYNHGPGPVPFPFSTTTYAWSGFALTRWVVDLSTGYYIVQGTQAISGQEHCWVHGQFPHCQPWFVDAFRIVSAVPPMTTSCAFTATGCD